MFNPYIRVCIRVRIRSIRIRAIRIRAIRIRDLSQRIQRQKHQELNKACQIRFVMTHLVHS